MRKLRVKWKLLLLPLLPRRVTRQNLLKARRVQSLQMEQSKMLFLLQGMELLPKPKERRHQKLMPPLLLLLRGTPPLLLLRGTPPLLLLRGTPPLLLLRKERLLLLLLHLLR